MLNMSGVTHHHPSPVLYVQVRSHQSRQERRCNGALISDINDHPDHKSFSSLTCDCRAYTVTCPYNPQHIQQYRRTEQRLTRSAKKRKRRKRDDNDNDEHLEVLVEVEVATVLRCLLDNLDASVIDLLDACLLYTSPSPRDGLLSRMPSSA